MGSKTFMAAATLLVAMQSGCQTMNPNTTTGGLFGTAAGSLVGAAVGAHEGDAGKGALIGGLAGGTMGALLGNQADQANVRDEQNFLAAQQQAQAVAVSMDQVVQMTRSGLSDELIANQIITNGIVSQPNTNDLILLKQNGVSDRVIQALQSAPIAGRPMIAAITRPPDVIYAAPVCSGPPMFFQPPPMHFHHFRSPGRPPGTKFGFSAGF